MLLFEGTDFTAHTHTFGEYVHQVVVTFVNLSAELVQVCLLYTSDAADD